MNDSLSQFQKSQFQKKWVNLVLQIAHAIVGRIQTAVKPGLAESARFAPWPSVHPVTGD